jgi:hypothetical protein
VGTLSGTDDICPSARTVEYQSETGQDWDEKPKGNTTSITCRYREPGGTSHRGELEPATLRMASHQETTRS